MPRYIPVLIVLTSLQVVAVIVANQPVDGRNSDDDGNTPPAASSATDRSDSLIAGGEYLVHHVAMCVQCHSPRNLDGTLDQNRLLSGAPVPIKSPFQGQQWAFRAPSLRGLPGGWTEDQLVNFLQTGEPPTDYDIRPPMPPFRFREDDAQAIAAYLKSLQDVE